MQLLKPSAEPTCFEPPQWFWEIYFDQGGVAGNRNRRKKLESLEVV
jgi:hypothetical protein